MDRFVKSFMGKSVVESNLKRLEAFLNAERGFLLITAHSPDIVIDDEINLCRDLLADIKAKKLGYIPLRYKYVKENEIVYQHGFFISNSESGKDNFLIKAKSLCKKHTEEPALYVEKGKAYWLYPDGTITLFGDSIGTLEEIRNFWVKRINDNDFMFDSFESLYPINSFGLNAAHNWGELFSNLHNGMNQETVAYIDNEDYICKTSFIGTAAGLEIWICKNKNITSPHFFFWNSDQTICGCIKLETAEYLEQGKYKDKLNFARKRHLTAFLKANSKNFIGLTNWQVVIGAWNTSNPQNPVDLSLTMPNYIELK